MKTHIKETTLYTLIMLALPAMAEQVLSTLLQYVDTAMVGHLGEAATASVNVTTTINWLMGSAMSAVGVAAIALISRSIGEGNIEKSRLVARITFLTSVSIGILVEALALILSPYIPMWMGADKAILSAASEYFFITCLPLVFRCFTHVLASAIRATKDTKTPMVINLSANVLNVALNYLLIYYVGWGVRGAAIASAIAYTISGVAMMLTFFNKEELRFIAHSEKNLEKVEAKSKLIVDRSAIIKEMITITIPVLAVNITSCMGYVVFAAIVTRMGTTIFAAHSIAVDAEEIFYMPGYGIRMATQTLIGIAIGKKDEKEFKEVVKAGYIAVLMVSVILGALLFFVSYPLMQIFTSSDAVAQLGSEVLKIVAFSEPFFAIMVVSEGVFYGMGRTKYCFYVETFSMWCVRIVSTFVCVRILQQNLDYVWYCMIADNITKALLLCIPVIIGVKRHKWFMVQSKL